MKRASLTFGVLFSCALVLEFGGFLSRDAGEPALHGNQPDVGVGAEATIVAGGESLETRLAEIDSVPGSFQRNLRLISLIARTDSTELPKILAWYVKRRSSPNTPTVVNDFAARRSPRQEASFG